MIEYISGRLAELNPAVAVIDTGGIGYELNITLNTFTAIQKLSSDGTPLGDIPEHKALKCKLFVHEVIREDAHILYGFAEKRERELFRALIGVSGVGSASARMILSAISPAELEQVITSGDERRLKSVKGIGGKTAQRIIVDLRDKIKPTGDSLFIQPQQRSEVFDEALAALLVLGFAKPVSEKVLTTLLQANPELRIDQAIKEALKQL